MVTIRVTREHIGKGEPRSSCRCPVALALKEAFPGRQVRVTESSIRLGRYVDPDHLQLRAPESVFRFVRDFDRSGETGNRLPDPFEFELET